jgi:hypothetical protein
MVDGRVTGKSQVGGLIGWCGYGVMYDCHVVGIVKGVSCIGGLIGCGEISSFQHCSAAGAVTGECYVGGLAGGGYAYWISNSCFTGAVTGTSDYVGGLVGDLNGGTYGVISRCYVAGDVKGASHVGV